MSADRRNGLFWKLQALLRRKEAESVRDRVEELIERGEERRQHATPDPRDLDPHERALLSNVLRLRGKTAYDVMVPRADIVAMPEDLHARPGDRADPAEGHSRYPVYRESLDDIVGMVHIKDVFAAVGRDRPLRPEGDPAQAAVRRAADPGARPAAADAPGSASTWRWWWTSTAASTA
jgi:magnesium and cobalt transporter